MSNATYKVIEVIGSSPKSWEDAAKNAIEKTMAHVEDLRVAEVVDQDVRIEKGKVTAFRTKLSLSFRVRDSSELHK